MRHRKKRQKLGRTHSQRRAFLRSLVTPLVLKERITTTEGKAKKIKSFLEKIISRSRNNTLANRRILLRDFSPKVVNKLIEEIGPRYKERPGGYSRIIKTSSRKNDTASMVIIELIK